MLKIIFFNIIVYYSIVFTKSTLEFWRQIIKREWGFPIKSQNFNVGFVKPTLYNIFSYIFLNVFNWRYQTYRTKEIQHFFLFFTRLFMGGELRAYKIKSVLFLYAVGLFAATKTLSK